MNKKILRIAITCFSCLLLIAGFAIAGKPEWAGKSERIEKKQTERIIKREAKKLEREEKRELSKAERAAKKAEREKKGRT